MRLHVPPTPSISTTDSIVRVPVAFVTFTSHLGRRELEDL
jgi:hypothetical protein